MVADHAFITHSGEVPEEMLSQLTALVRELAPFEEVFVTQAAARFPPTAARARWACCSCGRRDETGNRVQTGAGSCRRRLGLRYGRRRRENFPPIPRPLSEQSVNNSLAPLRTP